MHPFKGKYLRFQALIAALLIHVAVLSVLGFVQLDAVDPVPQFVEVQWDIERVDPIVSQSLEQQLSDRLQEQIANLASDLTADKTDEKQQSIDRNSRDFTGEVEAELSEFERATFEELAQSRAQDAGAATPNDLARDSTPDANRDEPSYDWQGKAYNGRVTAEYDLGGRLARNIDIPGYRCEGAAEVELEIEVAPDGSVRSAVVVSGASSESSGEETCVEREAIKSALRSRFVAQADAPKQQAGRLTYRFVPQ
jgi:hypothetical protein